MKRFTPFLAIILVLALAMLACQAAGRSASPSSQVYQFPTPLAPANAPAVNLPPALDLVTSQDTLIKLYQSVNPGVVALRVLTSEGDALGSGFVIDSNGHIVTNYHVVEGETDLEVAFSSGLKVRGKVVGNDPDSDLAVISVNAPKDQLHPLALGNSDLLQVGQAVVAIGNPFGLEGTMTTGIVSGLGRTVLSLHSTASGTFSAPDVVQTDAAINPGNSGGPLLNLNGEVVGVNESIATTSGTRSNSGVGFAISVNIVKRVVPTLIAKGSYEYPYLGIYSLNDLGLAEQEALGLPRSTGVYVTNVEAGGPAAKAGVRGGSRNTSQPNLQSGGDLIIAIDGQPVNTYNDLIGYIIKNKAPGDTVELTVLRGDQEVKIKLVLGKRPDR